MEGQNGNAAEQVPPMRNMPRWEKPDFDAALLLCLRLGAFLCFAGWTWVHLYWEGPYGILLWQEDTYRLANKFGIYWEEFVGTGAEAGFVQKWLAHTGWLYLACTVLTITVRKKSWVQMAALVGGGGLVTILAYAKYVASRRQLPMLIEHGGQVLIPVLLVMALALGVRHRLTVATAIVAVITTFAGHGSYAVGFWPIPGNFHAMTSMILRVDYVTTKAILHLVGVLDFVVCIGILIPGLRRPVALYAAAWGFLTAIARPVAGMSLSLNYWGADQFLQEAVFRAPHVLIPLYLFFLWSQPRQDVIPAPAPRPEPADSAPLPPVARTILLTNPNSVPTPRS